MKELLKKLEEAKLKILETAPEEALKIKSIPFYKGNKGFFHILAATGELILLKSCYSDFVRVIKKDVPAELTEEKLNNMSRVLTQIEITLEGLYEAELYLYKDEFYILSVKEVKLEISQHSLDIPRPLTSSEYSMAEGGFIGKEALFSRSIFNTLFPERLTLMSTDLFTNYSDILSSFFLFINAKVDSPSLKIINLRPYANISGIFKGFSEARIDPALFEQEYMPWQKIFASQSHKKHTLFLANNIKNDELNDFIELIEQNIKDKTILSLFEPEFFEPVAQMTMLGLLLTFMFQEEVAFIMKELNIDKENVLRFIYKSRENSFFIKGGELEIPDYFDLNQVSKHLSIKPMAKAIPPDAILEPLSSFARFRKGKKVLQAIKKAHFTLDTRDKLLLSAGKYHKITKKIVDEHIKYIVGSKIKEFEQGYLFDLSDLRKLYNDSYYSNLTAMLAYKTSYNERIKSQPAVYEIFEEDIPYSGIIAEEQLEKFNDKAVENCFSFNHAEQRGTLESKEELADGKVCFGRNFPLAKLAEKKEPKAILVDFTSSFSYLTEYCLINDVPLYAGVRFIYLKPPGRGIRFSKEKIAWE